MPTHAAGGILALLSAFAQDPCFDPCFDPCARARGEGVQVGSDSAQKQPRARARDAPSAHPPNNSPGTQTQRGQCEPTPTQGAPAFAAKNGARRRRWHRPRARRDRRGQERQQQKLAGAASATPPARRSRPGKEGNRSTRSHQLAKRCVTNASHRVVQTQRDPPATQPLRQLTERYTTPHEAVQASRSALCRPAAACCADLPSPPRPQPTRNPPGQ